MKAGPVRCASCSKSVSNDALDSGDAILLLGKAYCPACKGAAASSVSLEDLAQAPAPPKPAPAPRASASTPAAGRKRTAVRRPPPSKTPLLAGLAALAVLGAAALFFAFRPRPGEPKPSTPDVASSGSTSTPPPPASASPEERAQHAYDGVEALAKREDVALDRLLTAIDGARAACKGTPYAAKLDEIKARALAEREREEAGKALNPLVEELKKAVAEDLAFQRYDELQGKFQKARELASRVSPGAVASLSTLQQDYGNRYEREAAPHYERIQPAAEQLAQEKRWDDALKYIDSFPAHLRGSGAWRGLAKLKERIESDRKLSPKK